MYANNFSTLCTQQCSYACRILSTTIISTFDRGSSGHGDIAKFFQMCIPLATEILGAVVVKYGFETSQNGAACISQQRERSDVIHILGLIITILPLQAVSSSHPSWASSHRTPRFELSSRCSPTSAFGTGKLRSSAHAPTPSTPPLEGVLFVPHSPLHTAGTASPHARSTRPHVDATLPYH